MVRLHAYPRWAEGIEVPVLPGKWKLQGYELRTDGEGRFRFDVPVPTELVVFTLKPDDYHDTVRLVFGGTQDGNRLPLRRGDNDLGTFQLAATGALAGTVRDRHGNPIVGARVRLGSEPTQTEQREAETDASGRYLIGHAAEGAHGVIAQAEGFMNGFEKPFDVRRNETTQGPDFQLAEAPTIRGRVVDADGRPLENARLWGWPSTSGSGAGAKSGADGTFVIYLPQDEPYSLEVTLEGFEPFGHGDRTTLYKPGSKDIVCVLKSDVSTTFVVIDAATGSPVTTYDIRIIRDKGSRSEKRSFSWSEWTPEFRDHPKGELTIGARPGVDRYEIASPTHARKDGEVEHESERSTRQVIQLEPGATLLGRVIRRGDPVPGAQIKIERGAMRSIGGQQKSGSAFRAESGEAGFAKADEHGRFSLPGVDRGTHRITIESAGEVPLVLVPIHVRSRSAQDLGDLELVAGGSIRGRVKMPGNRSAAGLEIQLDLDRDGRTAVVDSEGRFQFDAVPSGDHYLQATEKPGRLAGGAPMPVSLAPGESKSVEIDLSDRGICSLAVRVMVAGRAVSDAEVHCELPDAADSEERLGRTGEDGWARSSPRARGRSRLAVTAKDGAPLGIDPVLIDLLDGATLERSIDLVVGSLVIEWPDEYAVAVGSRIQFELRRTDPEQATHWIRTRGAEAGETGGVEISSYVLGAIAPGEYQVILRIPRTSGTQDARTPVQLEGSVSVLPMREARVLLRVSGQ